MGNVVDYVRREFHGFAELPFGDVDSLVLAELSYMRLSGLVPAFGEARSVATVPIRELLRAESYDDMFVSNSSDINEYRLALLRAVCESPRFRALRVGEYAERLSEREQQQFAAMTFDVGCGPVDSLYVAFRGTDGTLVGWKEDFNMAVRCPVPSQESAYRYVNSILDRSEGFLSSGDSPAVMLGGHSKGGNMAVYAAMRIAHDDIEVAGERARRLGLLPSLGGPVRGRNRRISRIFSHDGPGLPKSTVRGQAYRAIESRIRKTVPESSVVGMLLQSNAPVRIVKADAIGIMQHMGNSWQVAENGDFEQVDELTAGAQLIKRTLDGWLDTVSQEQRERARAARGDISCHQHTNIAGFKISQRTCTRPLALIAVDSRGLDPFPFETFSQAVGNMLGSSENEYLLPIILGNQVSQQGRLIGLVDGMNQLFDAFGCAIAWRNFNRERIIQQAGGQLADLIGEGCREQQVLPFLR